MRLQSNLNPNEALKAQPIYAKPRDINATPENSAADYFKSLINS